MQSCLKIVKLALSGLSELNDQEIELNRKEIMKEHIENCQSCSSFLEKLNVEHNLLDN